MRAFGFEKEPVFKAMEATSIWGSLIAAGASLVGGAMGAKASKDASKAQAAADKAALDFQKRQYEESKGYLEPYRRRGSRADASLDALYYGTSESPGGYLSGASPDSDRAALKYMYDTATPEARAVINNLMGRSGGDPLEAVRTATTMFPNWKAEYDAARKSLTAKQQTEKPITREDVMAQIAQTPMSQYNEQDYAAAQDFSDDEIAAWEANAEAERDKSMDALFNRGGLTGQVGSTRRGVAQVGEEFGRDRAQYEAGRRRSDYGRYSEGRYAALDDYTGYLTDESSRGYDATGRLVSGGQAYADRASDMTRNSGRSKAGYLKERADTWGNAIGNAGGYVAAGLSESGKRRNPSYSIPDDYEDYESVGGGYGDYTDASSGYFSTKPKGGKSSNMYAGLY